MRIWVYTICYNEQHFVKNFLAAYSEAERIIAYDNQSTDDTCALLSQDPRVTIRINDSGGQIRDDLYLQIKNNCWKEARGLADWVVIVDFDEILCLAYRSGNNEAVLSLNFDKPFNDGYTVIKPYGYNMISIDAPLGSDGHPFNYCQTGVYHWPQEKPCAFRPDKLLETNYYPGCHGMDAKGEINTYAGAEYKLLHFKLWNLQHYLDRMRMYSTRMSAINRNQGWGEHYLWPIERHERAFRDAFAASRNLFDILKTDKIYV